MSNQFFLVLSIVGKLQSTQVLTCCQQCFPQQLSDGGNWEHNTVKVTSTEYDTLIYNFLYFFIITIGLKKNNKIILDIKNYNI